MAQLLFGFFARRNVLNHVDEIVDCPVALAYAADGLLASAIRWFAPVVPTFDSYDWRNGLEGNLISFLWACWERKREQISADPELERDFRALLTTAVSRGSHAAIALRDHVVGSAAA